jgi:excisionase family DNA binding protein
MVANTSTNDASDSQQFDPLGWRRDSVCRKHPTQWWFAGGAQETLLAKNICSGCTVKDPCLEFALSRPDLLGIWAATTPTERVTMRRRQRTSLDDELTDPGDAGDAELGAANAPTDIGSGRRPAIAGLAATTLAPKPRSAYGPRRMSTREIALTDGDDRSDRTDRSERRDLSDLLTPAEAAHFLGVTPNTVTRWSRAGKISAIQTMGGHRRFRRSEIERVLRDANLVSARAT